MNLDDETIFKELDSQNIMAEIHSLPDQLWSAWELGHRQPLQQIPGLQSIIVAGMGGSAAGGDMLAAYAAPLCSIPIHILREYDLPAWAVGSKTLVICFSHSGDTEETLSVYAQALGRSCSLIAMTTGGRLAEFASADGVPLWKFQHSGQPRAAVGYSFGLLLAAVSRLGLVASPVEELQEALHAMRNQQMNLLPQIPVIMNPAKRLAGQLMGRLVVVFGADALEPVARRWKNQINELAKAWSQYDSLPEADHNTLAGLDSPESILRQTIALFLQAPSNHPRNQIRLEITRQMFMTQGINTDFINARGATRLAHSWTLLHFGDYVAYYLAMAYGEDPTPVEALQMLKEELDR